MTGLSVEDRLEAAVGLRKDGDAEAARRSLMDLVADHPDDARVNLQCAWTHDSLGLEREAVPFYQRAIELGLERPDLEDALLGLGSTHRALGSYDEAVATLTQGVEEFPENHAMKVFQAMALYNGGQAKQACESLLRILIDTTADPGIRSYQPALDAYAADLDRTWT